MFDILVKLQSASPFSFGTPAKTQKDANESDDAHDKRVFRERCYVGPDGKIIIPRSMFKNAVADTAKHMGEKIPGKGSATWTKHFEAGIHVLSDIATKWKPDDAPFEDVYCYAQGHKSDAEGRVWRRFITIPEWTGEILFRVVDPVVTVKQFLKTLRMTGLIMGIGRWPLRNRGGYGAFAVLEYSVSNEKLLEEEEMPETKAPKEKAKAVTK